VPAAAAVRPALTAAQAGLPVLPQAPMPPVVGTERSRARRACTCRRSRRPGRVQPRGRPRTRCGGSRRCMRQPRRTQATKPRSGVAGARRAVRGAGRVRRARRGGRQPGAQEQQDEAGAGHVQEGRCERRILRVVMESAQAGRCLRLDWQPPACLLGAALRRTRQWPQHVSAELQAAQHGCLGAGGCLLPACWPSLTVGMCMAPAPGARMAPAHRLTLGTAGTDGWVGAHKPSGGPARRPLQQGRLQAAAGARRRVLPSVPVSAPAARRGQRWRERCLLCARRCEPARRTPARARPSGAPRLTQHVGGMSGSLPA